MGVVVTLNTGPLDALIGGWDDEIGKLLDTTANDVLAEAVQRAPKKTGYMASTGHVEPGDDKYSRYVVFSANYSIFVHEGTRFMAARPFLRQSVEHHRLPYQEAFSALGKLHTL
jgi:hypothetical protein